MPSQEIRYAFIDSQNLNLAIRDQGWFLDFKRFRKFLSEKHGIDRAYLFVDAELVLHAMIQFSNYDKAVIVTGDGDFACLVQYLNENHKLYRLLVPNSKKYSSLLRQAAADKIDFMNNLRVKLEYKKRGPIA